jgi:hypothetical protein
MFEANAHFENLHDSREKNDFMKSTALTWQILSRVAMLRYGGDPTANRFARSRTATTQFIIESDGGRKREGERENKGRKLKQSRMY